MLSRFVLLCFGLGSGLRLAIGDEAAGLDAHKLKLLPRYCGLNVPKRLWSTNVEIFEYPWIALLQYDREGEIQHWCSGSLINNHYVLTAAHCLTNETGQLLNVRLGELDKSQYMDCEMNPVLEERECAEPADDYGVESVTIHPNYDRKTFRNDIGLIRLNRNVTMDVNTSPICLPITSSLRSPAVRRYEAAGWGTCGNQTGHDRLQRLALRAADEAECSRAVALEQIDEGQICVGHFANSDIGGPLVSKMEYPHGGMRFVQLGVASGALDSCAQGTIPGVYTGVANYMEWILNTIHP